MRLPFIKMNGAGNDFVVLDARHAPVALSLDQLKAIAARDNEITGGCDQVIILEPAEGADAFMRIYNADGGQVDACGNAHAASAGKSSAKKNDPLHHAKIKTNAGTLWCRQVVSNEYPSNFRGSDAMMEADMGPPRFLPEQIPVSGEYPRDVLLKVAADLNIDTLIDATCVGMGNPHVVFFVSKLPSMSLLEEAGEKIKPCRCLCSME